MKNKKKKQDKNEQMNRRQFFEKIAGGAKLVAVGAIASEAVEYVPGLKAQRPDLLPGGEGDFAGT